MKKTKLLFVCSGNLNRSPTAEALFKNSRKYETQSVGTHPLAVNRVNQAIVDWADKIFVMSERDEGHFSYLKNNFSILGKEIINLDIPDVYNQDDPILIGLLKEKLSKYLDIE